MSYSGPAPFSVAIACETRGKRVGDEVVLQPQLILELVSALLDAQIAARRRPAERVHVDHQTVLHPHENRDQAFDRKRLKLRVGVGAAQGTRKNGGQLVFKLRSLHHKYFSRSYQTQPVRLVRPGACRWGNAAGPPNAAVS